MELRQEDLLAVARQGVVTPAQADELWRALSAAPPAPDPVPVAPSSTAREVLLLAAGMLAAAPAAAVALSTWERFGGAAAAFGTSALAAAAALAGAGTLRRRAPGASAALLAAGLALVPFAVHCGEHWIGWAVTSPPPDDLGDWLLGHRLPPLAAAAAATVVALRILRYPVLAAALAAIAWFAAMDAAPAIFGPSPTWTQHALLSTLLGLAVLGTGFGLDGRTRRDHAGWLYVAGLVSFWGGLTTAQSASRTSLVLYVTVQLWLLAAALLVRRRAFAIAGAIGLAGAAGRIADATLEPAALPVVFAAVAAALAGGAVLWIRHEARMSGAVIERLPRRVRRLLPRAGAR
ncbi:hypothetical protein [Anaeromyxobacter oryzae]|uniref:DUF2157 domain-containing protein n=1 Tax=Anaeromyxobacter oryzae TaxID=2918170 RepID=A0ABM7WZ51_9BACT|nr:hypothetical protein [Anaeromyxobacter oryzae]BDG04823.1 hypothetical protein AMOR_38190 [Anaeromyxobacter oryzae]